MRKLDVISSFINRKENLSITKYFTSSKPEYFPLKTTFKNFFLKNLLRTTDSEIIVVSDSPTGEVLLCEKMKQAGLLYHYGEGTIINDYPKFNYAGLLFHVDSNHSEEIQTAWGYTMPYHKKEVAFSKALGEVIERQASYFTPTNKTAIFPTLKKGDASHLYQHIPKFSTEQSNRIPFVTKKSDMTSMLGFYAQSLTGDTKRFFPFEAFYWGHPASGDQPLFQHATTSGSGGGKTKTEATISGCFELIERDLLMLYWLSGVPAPIITNDSIPGNIGEYVKKCCNRYDLEIFFLNLSYDIAVTTIVCVVIDPTLQRVSMGAKSGLDLDSLLEGSLLEALAVLTTTRTKDKDWTDEELAETLKMKPFSYEISRKNRVTMYSNKTGVDIIRKKFLQGTAQPYSDILFITQQYKENAGDKELPYLIAEFKKLVSKKGAGYHAYIHQFNSRWLNELEYHAVHVFIPSFIKLHLNEIFATPVSDRLTEFALTYNLKIESERDVNPLPHFFP
jgi:thiazole/oxazole-forming peptide maturase SagD family component